MTAGQPTVWAAWNPDVPTGCPPDVWARAVVSARRMMTHPDEPRALCRTEEEVLWQGRADGLARGEKVPDRLRDWLVGLHRPYLIPPAEDTPAA